MESKENKICHRDESHLKRKIPVVEKNVGPLNIVPEESDTKTKGVDIDKMLACDVSSMARESPDGSSDTSEWQTTCSASRPPVAPKTKPSQSPSQSSSTISKLVQSRRVPPVASSTGARPKERSPAKPNEAEAVGSQFLGVTDDISSPRSSSISPSLLQVNYGTEGTTSDGGDSGSAHCQEKSSNTTPRIPQPRHRASSARVITFPVDSDHESEDNTSEVAVQVSRRRRRTVSCQPHMDVSVKSLVDSRGVLESGGHVQHNTSTDYVRSISQQFSDISSQKPSVRSMLSQHFDSATAVPSVTTPFSSTVSQIPPAKSTTPQISPIKSTPVVTVSNIPHVMSSPVIASFPDDVVDGVAFSAPEKEVTLDALPPKAVKVKKKSHSRSHSDGTEELLSKVRLSQSTTVPYLEVKSDSAKLLSASGDFGSSVPSQIHKRFMEDGGHSITPAADNGFFPRPEPGQSLIGFLSSKQFHKQYAELDRENAHFNISEAVIAALTQVRHINFCEGVYGYVFYKLLSGMLHHICFRYRYDLTGLQICNSK